MSTDTAPNIRLVVLRSDTFDNTHAADGTSGGTLIITERRPHAVTDRTVAGYSATSWVRFFYESVPSVPDYGLDDGGDGPAVGAI